MKHLDILWVGTIVVGFVVQRTMACRIPYSYRQNLRSTFSYLFGDSNLY